MAVSVYKNAVSFSEKEEGHILPINNVFTLANHHFDFIDASTWSVSQHICIGIIGLMLIILSGLFGLRCQRGWEINS